MDEQKQTHKIFYSTPSSERIEIIDALRGFAMLGIMVVNFPAANSFANQEGIFYGGVTSNLDKFIEQFGMLFFSGKFYFIFSILFGLSTYIFYTNALKKGLSAKVLLIRRFLFLSLFGLLHIIFVWWGDILFVYSILGMLLILFIDLHPKKLLKIVLLCLIIIPLIKTGLVEATRMNLIGLEKYFINGLGYPYTNEDLIRIYSGSQFFVIMKQRMVDYIYDFTFIFDTKITISTLVASIAYFAKIFGFFLFGIFIAKCEWHKRISTLLPKIIKLWWVFFIVVILFLTIVNFSPFLKSKCLWFLSENLAIFYILSFVILFTSNNNKNKNKKSKKIFELFSAVGKMSLSVYLAHTIFITFLLYGYGLGLYFKIGPAILFLTTITFYLIATKCCQLWQKRFEFGPIEQLWRKLTYYGFSSHL